MVEYRAFLNSDPQKLLELCLNAGLGRGMSQPKSTLPLDLTSYGLPYFEREGLIVAESDGEIVGFVHAGFGVTADRNEVDYSRGVICVLIVHPKHRRQGIAHKLLKLAEQYLIEHGAKTIQAGQSRGCDPFYFGIYGGARCSGFLESDQFSAPFFESVGYTPISASAVLQLDLKACKFPMNRTILDHKRKTDLVYSDKPSEKTMWWYSHFGNKESMFFELIGKSSGNRIASVSMVTLDSYNIAWKERAIGLVDLRVEEQYRGQRFSLSLIIEALSRIKNDMVTLAEVHVPEDNQIAMSSILTAGFKQVDRSVVYGKPE